MKKQLLWVLTLVVLALFPYQNAKADLIELSRSGWTAKADGYAQNNNDGPASYAINNNTNDWWHSRYDSSGGGSTTYQMPHYIQFDLGSEQTFEAFNYVSRSGLKSGDSANGNIADYKLYVSNSDMTSNLGDGYVPNNGTLVKAGTINDYNEGESPQSHIINLDKEYSGRYVLLLATTAVNKGNFAACAEFYLYKNDYCSPSGNMANNGNGAGRKFTSFTLSDGTNSVSLDNIQTSYTDAIYKDRTSDILETTAGATLSFTAMSGVDWMHGYVYIDYNGDKIFNTTANNNGTNSGELVSYNYYNNKNINNGSMSDNCGVSYSNIPSWTLPSNLATGTYRLRFKVDWNSLAPCGSSEMASNNGCVVDITLKVTDATPTNSRPQNLFSSEELELNKVYPHRIPGIAKAYNNDLIAVAAHLVCGTDPGYGQVDVSCRVSKDNGVTWSDTTLVAVGTGRTSRTENYFETAYGDPAIVADRESNKVAIFVVAGCTPYGSATRQHPNKIGVIYGTYNQSTESWEWENPKEITEDIYKLYDNVNTVQSAFIAGGKVFQSRIVKVGEYYRLYAAMCARPNGNRVIYSDDFGRTWKPLGGAAASITPDNGNEPKCEELPDGRVILSSRNANGNGRLYNIYTYTNTTTGEGSWSSCTASTFEGSNHAPGSNNTNGEILIVPVVRKSDSKEMYLALQSQPTGNDRVNVGIYYKELTNLDDMNTVSNFATGWNGFYQVSTTKSAYSSMDLQDDGKVGFIYEETLTSLGRVAQDPPSLFLDGTGYHNFDGYNNIYRAYTIEQLTNNAYTLKTDIDRGDFVKTYLTAAVDASALPTATKTTLKAEINKMGAEPTTAQVDAIYTELNKDPWDGQVVTFTNVQSNGDQRALYITGSVLTLGTTSQTAESLGASAQFLCKKEASGKYSFKNLATNEYMIWRAGSNYGYNNNKGTLASYEATYCDWLINDANSTKANTYCMVGKRSNGTDDGSLVVAESNGAFDSFGATPICGTHTNGSNYSNVYYINIVSTNVEQTIATAEEIISKSGVGYPKQGSTARTTLQNAITTAESDASVVNGIALQNAIDAYYTTTDIELPANGVLYSFIVGHTTNKAYIYNNNGTLAVAKYTDGMELPETAKFTCIVEDNYSVFRTSDGKYIAFPGYQADQYTGSSTDGIEDNITDLTRFTTPKILNGGNVAASSNVDLFGNVYLNAKLRGTINTGDSKGQTINGVYVVKFKNNGTQLDSPVWDGASVPYANDNFSSAVSIVAMGYPLTATVQPEGAGTATVSPTSVSAGESATFTASAADEGYIFDGWYNGSTRLTTELVYEATNITTALNLTAKYIAQAELPVTVPSTFGKVMKGDEEVSGSISGNAGETVTLTAEPDAGYIFDRWVVKYPANVEDTDKARIKTENPIEVTLGSCEVEAYFAPEAYKDVCKPSFTESGNTTVISQAEITNGEGVENCNIVGTTSNLWFDEGAVKVRPDLGIPAQSGATKAINVEPGATFTLDMTYMLNWHDITLYMLDSDDTNTEKIYGPYEGSWVYGGSVKTVLTNMQNAGITVDTDKNKASFPITISENLKNGELVVVRAVATSSESLSTPCASVTGEGAYLDFLFVVEDSAPERTISVNVTPAESATIWMNEEERTTLKAEGAITITAQPAKGYAFLNWTDKDGNELSDKPTIIDRTEGDKTYTANLIRAYTVTASVKSGQESFGSVQLTGGLGNGTFYDGTEATLVATPNAGYRFVHWTLNGNTITTDATYKTVIMANENYIAEFEKEYIEMTVWYMLGNDYIPTEENANRYLKSVTATAGGLVTTVFEAKNEKGLPRIDAEITAFAANTDNNPTPTTTGALIDKTGNPIKVLEGTTTLDLNFKAWMENMTIRGYSATPQLEQTQQAIYVDWNNDKDFMDDGENYDIAEDVYPNTQYVEEGGYNRQISIPENTPAGSYRMRVVYFDPTTTEYPWAETIVKEDLSEDEEAYRVINQGRAYDFTIQVVEDENYITFTAPGGTYYTVGDEADITINYPDATATIYYTVDGTDPNSYDPTLTSGGKIALNTYKAGEVELKARVGEAGTVYSAKYTVLPSSSNADLPTVTPNAAASTIIAAEIRNGNGIENGQIDYQFHQGQQVVLDPISVTSTATFDFDVTFKMNKYAITVWRLDVDNNNVTKSPILTSNAMEEVDINAYKTFLEGKSGVTPVILSESEKTLKLTFNVDINKMFDLVQGNSVIYRVIISSIQTENITPVPAPNADYGKGEYVDFVFTVAPQEEEIKLYGTQGKSIEVSVTTATDCFLSVGGKTQNVTAGEEVPVKAKLNAAGELAIEAVGGNISGINIDVLELGTNILLPETDLVKNVKLKSDADFNATTISSASVLPAQGVVVEVEKEIYVPYTIDGKMPTYFNFLSMPFDFDAGMNIEFFNPQTGEWQQALLEQDIRILLYKSGVRACGTNYYNNTWQTLGGTGGKIFANTGFVLVGNSDYGDAEHKMKVRFKSYYAEGQGAVKRELTYAQDGEPKSVKALPYRSTVGETHPLDADWQHVGSPYLAHSDGMDYVLYFHDGYKYKAVSQVENPTIAAFQSVMFQANLGELLEQNIVITPLAGASKTNAANGVYARANLAINDDECVKIVLKDDASENFVVNEDAWYMAPTANLFSSMSVNVAGSQASITVQPEATELPLTVYAGAKSQQTISLSRYDGEVNIFLKDAVTEEVVCLNDEDYTFTATPYTTISDRFTVSMVEPTGITESVATESKIKAVVLGNTIKLYGTAEGEQVSLYTANGMLITNQVAEDSVTTIETTATGVIIIKVAEETVKVVK